MLANAFVTIAKRVKMKIEAQETRVSVNPSAVINFSPIFKSANRSNSSSVKSYLRGRSSKTKEPGEFISSVVK